MELPLDHFRLLGVNPTTDAQAALQMLQQRLDRVPSEGYSLETLDARAELLRSSADLLSDATRRSRYEADLTAVSGSGGSVIPALDVPSSLEVGGLVLLLEAGQPLECFELASRSLQPPRAPALGSSREADLTLVAAQACLAGADDLQDQRRYEAAAQLLQQGQQLLQRTGQQPRLRQQLNEAFEALAPYRVLDLLSRPLTATTERSEGLALLGDLVERRGGLEGNGDLRLSRDDFQAFFKQIRSFLTVQEQVDLFSAWAEGSSAADFLATTALTASGFVQRKPERIAAALARLEASEQAGTATLRAALQLLLGRVDLAEQSFREGASPELLSWAAQQSQDPLAQLCAYCRDWLQRDVLPGYRDLEADPDLEAYFADRDVQAFIEAGDPSRSRATAASAPVLATSAVAGSPVGGTPVAGSAVAASVISPTPQSGNPFEGLLSSLGLAGGVRAAAGAADERLQSPPPEALSDAAWPGIAPDPADAAAPADAVEANSSGSGWQWPALPWRSWRLIGAAALGAAVVAGGAALLLRQPWRAPQPLVVQPLKPGISPPVASPPSAVEPGSREPAATSTASSPELPGSAEALPLQAAEPSEAQLRALLEAWLAAKAAVLAGQSSSLPLNELARESQVQRLEAERSRDAARRETQRVKATVTGFEVLERGPARLVARVSLDYSDSRLDSAGTTLERTGPTTLTNRYVFARDGQTWRLVAFSPAR